MKSEVLANYQFGWLAGLVLVLFIVVFVSMLAMIFRKGTNESYEEAAKLPLSDGGIKL